MSALNKTLDIAVRDAMSQRPHIARGLRPDLSVGDFIRSLTTKMNLPKTDSSGQPNAYHAYLHREGRHLHATETVGDALLPDDEIVLQPDIQAG